MPFDVTLPPELWLIILDMVITSGISLLEQCDHIFFPDIHSHLWSWVLRAPLDNSYGRLRLVCRTFNALLGASPHYIMESTRDSIPASVRAVYMVEYADQTPSENVRRLLEVPLLCRRLIHLDTLSKHSGLPKDMPTPFHLLCENCSPFPTSAV
jgi:hypothetical protein